MLAQSLLSAVDELVRLRVVLEVGELLLCQLVLLTQVISLTLQVLLGLLHLFELALKVLHQSLVLVVGLSELAILGDVVVLELVDLGVVLLAL